MVTVVVERRGVVRTLMEVLHLMPLPHHVVLGIGQEILPVLERRREIFRICGGVKILGEVGERIKRGYFEYFRRAR